MDFVTGLSILSDWKDNSYDSILVIIDKLTKMVHYEPVKVSINALGLVEVILNVVVWHYGLPDSIVINKGLLFTSKLWSLLCYFKQKLLIAFYLQIDGQIKRQNSIIVVYFQAFVNFEQND